LECNHDAGLLAQSTYPAFLKNRIAGPYGHLSNEAAAQIAHALAHPGLVQVVAAHLSVQNNRPELALSALAGVGAHVQASPQLSVASPQSGTGWLDVKG
jgi:phosphoribosyl 1,2-cyclic phosphodiesterase